MPKKQRRPVKKREREFSFHGFNITLKSKRKVTDRTYFALIGQVYADNITVNVGGETSMVLRLGWTQNLEYKGKFHRVFYGKITRFTTIDGTNWYNKKTKEYQNVEIPLDVFPNPYETDFILVPKAHRFFIRPTSKISVKAVQTFLNTSLKEVIKDGDKIYVNIISSQNEIDEILKARVITSLRVVVSYTNDDIGDKAQELMDRMLKEANIGQAEALFKPDATGTLDTDGKMVRGFLELAKENGTADATVITEGKKKRIRTSSHPEKIKVKSENDEVSMMRAIFSFAMAKWKRG